MKKKEFVVVASMLLTLLGCLVTGCSSEDFDMQKDQKTMARRKSLGGGEYYLTPNNTFVEIRLPSDLCTLGFNISWEGGLLERPYPRVSPVGQMFNNIQWTSRCYAVIQIGSDTYTNVSVANGQIESSQCSFYFEDIDISAKNATISYTIPYSVTLQSVEINENDSVQENGQNKSALKTVQTYPPISDICQGILNVSVGIEGRGY